MQHWYVYYKLTPAEREALLAQVRRVQHAVAAATDVRVRLLERTEQAETTTVMEVYEEIRDPAAFAARLESAARAHLPASHIAARRIERFRDA